LHPGSDKTALSVSLAPGGNSVAACFADQRVKVFSLPAWKERLTIQPILQPAAVAISGDEQLIVIAGNRLDRKAPQGLGNGGRTGIEREQVVLDQMESRLRSFDVSADGSLLAAGLEDGDVWMCDLRDRKELWFHSHEGPVRAVRFSPDATMLATGGEEKCVRI